MFQEECDAGAVDGLFHHAVGEKVVGSKGNASSELHLYRPHGGQPAHRFFCVLQLWRQ